MVEAKVKTLHLDAIYLLYRANLWVRLCSERIASRCANRFPGMLAADLNASRARVRRSNNLRGKSTYRYRPIYCDLTPKGHQLPSGERRCQMKRPASPLA